MLHISMATPYMGTIPYQHVLKAENDTLCQSLYINITDINAIRIHGVTGPGRLAVCTWMCPVQCTSPIHKRICVFLINRDCPCSFPFVYSMHHCRCIQLEQVIIQ